MAVPDSTIRLGARIPIASIPAPGDTTFAWQGEVEVVSHADSRCSGLWGGSGWSDYLVQTRQSSSPADGRGPFVAAIGAPGFLVRHGRLELDLDGDGTLEVFRSCTSNEGVHLTAWAGEALTGRRVWHQYFALGYDVEPSCLPADYEGTP